MMRHTLFWVKQEQLILNPAWENAKTKLLGLIMILSAAGTEPGHSKLTLKLFWRKKT